MKRWLCTALLLLVCARVEPRTSGFGSVAAAQDVLDADEWEGVLRATTPAAPEAKEARASVADRPRRRGHGKNSDQERAAAAVDALGQPEQAGAAADKAPAGKRGKHAAAAADADKASGEKAGGTDAAHAKHAGAAAESEKSSAGAEGEHAKHAAAAEGEKPSAGSRETGRRKHAPEAEKPREGEAGARGREQDKASASSRKGGTTAQKSSARESAKTGAVPKGEPVFKYEKSDRGVPANYVTLKRSWHARWHADSRAKMAGLAPPLIIHPVHPIGSNQAPYVLLPESTQGGFSEAQIAVASQAWGSWPGGPQVAHRLLNLIYHAAMHFDVFHVHLISGVRKDRGGSRHSHGLAADIVLPGVEDEELARYFRAQGFCGVGIYTRAGFTHIDTRDKSYFWLDWSLPGRKNRQQQVHEEEAKAADEAAVARGQDAFVNPPRLQRALEARLRKRRGKSKASAAPAAQEGS